MRNLVLISLFSTGILWGGAEGYFQAFPKLKAEEKWNAIVEMGQEALKEEIPSIDAMQIHAQLASTFFYQGDFEKAKSHASLCLALARDEGDLEQEIRALYLLSASARAMQAYGPAKEYAHLALGKVGNGSLRAKVLFNLGAAEADDPMGNLTAAQNAYEEALHLFTCPEDRARTTIRLGKVYLLLGDVKKAKELVLGSLTSIESERVKSQAEYLMAQIAKAEGTVDEARAFAERALCRSQSLMARKDCERIQAFLESL